MPMYERYLRGAASRRAPSAMARGRRAAVQNWGPDDAKGVGHVVRCVENRRVFQQRQKRGQQAGRRAGTEHARIQLADGDDRHIKPAAVLKEPVLHVPVALR
jgi:hypothetical protein